MDGVILGSIYQKSSLISNRSDKSNLVQTLYILSPYYCLPYQPHRTLHKYISLAAVRFNLLPDLLTNIRLHLPIFLVVNELRGFDDWRDQKCRSNAQPNNGQSPNGRGQRSECSFDSILLDLVRAQHGEPQNERLSHAPH